MSGECEYVKLFGGNRLDMLRCLRNRLRHRQKALVGHLRALDESLLVCVVDT